MHGPTYMANPLACAAANASLDLFESEPRLAQVAALSERLRTGLAPCLALPCVRDVRVLGAIGVVALHAIGDLAALKAALIALCLDQAFSQHRLSHAGIHDGRRGSGRLMQRGFFSVAHPAVAAAPFCLKAREERKVGGMSHSPKPPALFLFGREQPEYSAQESRRQGGKRIHADLGVAQLRAPKPGRKHAAAFFGAEQFAQDRQPARQLIEEIRRNDGARHIRAVRDQIDRALAVIPNDAENARASSSRSTCCS